MTHVAASALLASLGLLVLLGLVWFGLISRAEGERRASRMAFGAGVAGSAALLVLASLPEPIPAIALAVVMLAGLAAAVALAWPGGLPSVEPETPRSRVDERDIMFARRRLQPGSPEFESYYQMRPENLRPDELTRRMPGLLSPDAMFGDARLFASAEASFGLTEALRDAVDGPVSEGPVSNGPESDGPASDGPATSVPVSDGLAVDTPVSSGSPADDPTLSPEEITAYVKALARFYGARDVGVTTLRPYHVYSHVGRGTGEYGAPIEVDGRFAIAFTVEMAFDMVGAAPHAPTVMESARQYVEAARVAVQLAGAIRALGSPARAHIDGNYRVVAPLVARDAGLGEIGRMGLLMTAREGPRVRLGVVTTDLGLVADTYVPDGAVIDFCTRCKKCADSCPSNAIPFGDREEIDGAVRWRIDSDDCFRHWNVIGTDCARCMAVCPYSHPDSLAHNVIRWGIGRSVLARKVALKLDDAFYGREPETRQPPKWTKVGREP